MSSKKKKKMQQQQPELIGSADYFANREIDQIIKKGRDRIKHAITVSDEKLTRTKKQIIREMAVQLEKAGYPVNQICDRLSKSLKSLVNDRTVRDALESKYKDQSQSQVAAAQNHDGGSLYRQQEQLRKKDIKEVTFDDLKLINNLTKVKQVAKHQMQKALWWEQQTKQNEAKIADLEKKTAAAEEKAQAATKFFTHVRDYKSSDAELGKAIREAAERFLKVQDKEKAHSTTNTPIEKEKTAPAQQEQG